MKRAATLSLAFLLAVAICSAASFVVPPPAAATAKAPAPLKASDIRIPVGNTGTFIDLQQLSTMKVADYEKMTGQKMSWFHRLAFRVAQKKLRRSINADGTVNNKKLERLAREMGNDSGFHLGGFALGFFFWLIGVLIAYLIMQGPHRARVKWAWIGFAVSLLIWIIIIH